LHRPDVLGWQAVRASRAKTIVRGFAFQIIDKEQHQEFRDRMKSSHSAKGMSLGHKRGGCVESGSDTLVCEKVELGS